ncbi:aminoglycoside N(3)-acetyltransferase [Halarchaeum sp. P4]|uniref:aminoglycoside N(3)-acetyltransferase n=1 Tax=Halarchaeum sp. P4 TaxID=3421639 RepID=UPI003EBFA48E
MSEADAVERSEAPVTADRLVDDLRALGVEAGDVLLVHSSLSSLGWVPGGAQTVVDALQRAVTDSGTLVLPTHSSQLCSSELWSNPPIPDDWLPEVREAMPAYDPDVTPTRGMGAIPECFRTHPDVRRSAHPSNSFAAWGAERDAVVDNHGLDYGLGEESPLAAVYERDGRVLLLGVGHEANTSLHLAEDRAEYDTETVTEEGPVRRDGERQWVTFEDVERETDDFPTLGAAFEADVGLREGTVGLADAKLADQRALVDYATTWMTENR